MKRSDWRRLYDAFSILSNRGFDPGESPYVRDCRRAIEGTAHEVAHAIAARMTLPAKPTPDSVMSEAIGRHHRKLSQRGSDEQELRTCAIEIEGLALLGVRLSVRRLASFARENMKYDRYLYAATCVRAIEQFRRRPSVERDARRFARYVRAAMASV